MSLSDLATAQETLVGKRARRSAAMAREAGTQKARIPWKEREGLPVLFLKKMKTVLVYLRLYGVVCV